jgi:hypothetical protein
MLTACASQGAQPSLDDTLGQRVRAWVGQRFESPISPMGRLGIPHREIDENGVRLLFWTFDRERTGHPCTLRLDVDESGIVQRADIDTNNPTCGELLHLLTDPRPIRPMIPFEPGPPQR